MLSVGAARGCWICSLVLSFLVAELQAQGSAEKDRAFLYGRVQEDSTGRALPGAVVRLEGTDFVSAADGSGRYRLAGIPPGAYVALFRLVGYRLFQTRVELRAGDSTLADVSLMPEPVQVLDPLEVTGRVPVPRGIGREGFDERRRMGFGFFVDSAELRRSEHRRVADVLRGIRGLNVVRFQECTEGGRRACGPIEQRAASGRGEISMGRSLTRGELQSRDTYCWMTVYLDGNLVYTSGGIRPPPDFGRDFSVSQLHAIEVYRSSSEAPPEYSGTVGACGVILLWSKK